jgi:hypothetical protein
VPVDPLEHRDVGRRSRTNPRRRDPAGWCPTLHRHACRLSRLMTARCHSLQNAKSSRVATVSGGT